MYTTKLGITDAFTKALVARGFKPTRIITENGKPLVGWKK